jgi:hypothetical protein
LHEVDSVRRIFKMFITGHFSETQITRILNHEGIRPDPNATWTPMRLHNILTNEKYIDILMHMIAHIEILPRQITPKYTSSED